MQQYAIQCHSEPLRATQSHSVPFSVLLTILAFILAILSCKRASPCKVTVLCSWVKTLKSSSISLSLSTQEYKMGTSDLSWKPDEIRGLMCHAMETRLNSSWMGKPA